MHLHTTRGIFDRIRHPLCVWGLRDGVILALIHFDAFALLLLTDIHSFQTSSCLVVCRWLLLSGELTGRGNCPLPLFLVAPLQRYNRRYPFCNSAGEQNANPKIYPHVIRTASVRCEANYFQPLAPARSAGHVLDGLKRARARGAFSIATLRFTRAEHQ